MFWPKSFKNSWTRFNAESDDAVFKIILNKYYGMFQVSALYPTFNGFWLYFSVIQFFTYVFVIAYHWILLVISVPKMSKINFVLFSQAIHYLVLATLTIAVLIYVFSQRPTVARFHKKIHGGVYDYQEDDGEIFQHFENESLTEWKKLLVVPIVVAVAVGAVLVFGPIIDNYGTFNEDDVDDPTIAYNIPVPMFNILNTKEPNQRNVVSLLQLIAGGIVGLAFATGGLGYICITQTVTREFRILIHAVENIEVRVANMHLRKYGIKPLGEPKNPYKSKTFNQCLDVCFKKLYEHHLAIISLANDMTAVLGFPNMIAFGGGPLIIGMALLSTTTAGSQLPGTTLSSIVLCGVEIVYMYLFASLGQRVTDLSEEFRRKLYAINWYLFEKNIKVNLNILQVATLTPYVLYAPFKSMPSTLETFGSVMNSAYSFYNLMLAMN